MKSMSKNSKASRPQKPHPFSRPAADSSDAPKFGGGAFSARPSSSTNLAQVSQPQESFNFGNSANLKQDQPAGDLPKVEDRADDFGKPPSPTRKSVRDKKAIDYGQLVKGTAPDQDGADGLGGATSKKPKSSGSVAQASAETEKKINEA